MVKMYSLVFLVVLSFGYAYLNVTILQYIFRNDKCLRDIKNNLYCKTI